MARKITLGRTEAEWLVDLLEEADPRNTGIWRIELSRKIRASFGMREMQNFDKVKSDAIDHILNKSTI